MISWLVQLQHCDEYVLREGKTKQDVMVPEWGITAVEAVPVTFFDSERFTITTRKHNGVTWVRVLTKFPM